MAKQQGGDGKGLSKFRTAAEDAADRRSARHNKRRNRRGKDLGGTDFRAGTGTIFAGVRADRAAEREEREQARRQALLEREFNNTLSHLQRFGNQPVPGYASQRPRWTVTGHAAAERLLHLYFFGPDNEIGAQELGMGDRVVGEVRRRFAGACFLRTLHGLPGQEQSWFEEALAAAQAFHEGRRTVARQAAVEAPAPIADQATVPAAT